MVRKYFLILTVGVFFLSLGLILIKQPQRSLEITVTVPPNLFLNRTQGNSSSNSDALHYALAPDIESSSDTAPNEEDENKKQLIQKTIKTNGIPREDVKVQTVKNEGQLVIPVVTVPLDGESEKRDIISRNTTSADSLSADKESQEVDLASVLSTMAKRFGEGESSDLEDQSEPDCVAVSFPHQLNTRNTALIRLEFGRPKLAQIKADSEKESDKQSEESLFKTNACKPGTPLSKCLSDSDAEMSAELIGSGFEIETGSSHKLSKKITGSHPVWLWSIRAKDNIEGVQELLLNVNFAWIDEKNPQKFSITRNLQIAVVKPIFEWGTVSIIGLVCAVVGTLLGTIFTLALFPLTLKKLRKSFGIRIDDIHKTNP